MWFFNVIHIIYLFLQHKMWLQINELLIYCCAVWWHLCHIRWIFTLSGIILTDQMIRVLNFQQEDGQQSVVGTVWSEYIPVLLLQCYITENSVASTTELWHNPTCKAPGNVVCWSVVEDVQYLVLLNTFMLVVMNPLVYPDWVSLCFHSFL